MKMSLVLVFVTFHWLVLTGFGQDMEGFKVIDRDLAKYTKAEFTVPDLEPEAEFSQLSSYTDAQGRVVKVANFQRFEEGGGATQSYYFDPSGALAVAQSITKSPTEEGGVYYEEETFYFKAKQLQANDLASFRFNKGEEVDPSKLVSDLVLASETDIPKRDSYESHLRRAEVIARAVKAFSNPQAVAVLEGRSLLDSISPDGRYVVVWSAQGDEGASFELLDLTTGRRVGALPGGMSPEYSGVGYWTEWSADSRLMIFGFDARWTTMDAKLIEVTPTGLKTVGDVNEGVGKLALAHLKQSKHSYAENAESVHGFVEVLSLENDGRIHLVLLTETKDLAVEDGTLQTEMTLMLGGDGSAKATGVRSLKPGQEPQENAAGEEVIPKASPVVKPKEAAARGLVVAATKIGAISAETRFDFKEVRKLFPDHQVVVGKETFEEGEEQPVIRVMSGEEVLLTLVPIPDEAKIRYVYSTHSSVKTQLGFGAGDLFGEVFESIPEHAVLEGISGEVVTEAPGLANVRFRFVPAEGHLDGNDLPAYRELKAWRLYSIEWLPGGGW